MRGIRASIFTFLVLLLPFLPSLGGKVPQPRGYVNDFAGVIGPEYSSQIAYLARQLKEKTGAEIAVVTVGSLGDLSPEEFANQLFQRWGIGQKGKDNGVLILLALGDKKVRIEPGYGLEGPLPDGFCGGVIRKVMLPLFREGNYGRGLYLGTAAVAQRVASEYGVELADQEGKRLPPYNPGAGPRCGSLLSALLLFLFFILLMRGRFFLPGLIQA